MGQGYLSCRRPATHLEPRQWNEHRSRFSRPLAPERVLKIASELFYAEGINTVGVDRIAAEADASKATLYAHYGNKDGPSPPTSIACPLARRSA
jgi:hypothetical protein